MPTPRAPALQNLFASRLSAGEDLYFRSPLGRPEPADTRLVVASDGAVEVAWPWAYLCGLIVVRVYPGDGPLDLSSLQGCSLALVDDGLLAPDAIATVLDAMVRAQPRALIAVAPAFTRAVRRVCRAALVDRILTLRPSTEADRAPRLYPQRPMAPSVARTLLSEVEQSRSAPASGLHLVA